MQSMQNYVAYLPVRLVNNYTQGTQIGKRKQVPLPQVTTRLQMATTPWYEINFQ